MTLSVMSALARLGFDPWREAARLAGLPKPQAVAALTGLFTRLDGMVERPRDAVDRATRLVGLLPLVSPTIARAPTGLRRLLRRPRLGVSEICLLLALAALALTFASRSFLSHDEPPSAAISARP